MGIAIITGASSGMGRAIAQEAARRGHTEEIWAVARRRERLEQLSEELPIPVRPLSLDLTRHEDLSALASLLEQERPSISLLVNAAGFGKFGTCRDMTLEESDGMVDLNARALMDVTILALPYLERGSGIIQLCSSSAFQPLPGLGIYAATKAFVLRYTRALRWELLGRGISVTAVCPGWVKTEFLQVAQTTRNGRTVTWFPFAQSPRTVARRALLANRLGLAVATCGPIAFTLRILSKFLPHCIIMAGWNLLRMSRPPQTGPKK